MSQSILPSVAPRPPSHVGPRPAVLTPEHPEWRGALDHVVRQEPLILGRPSFEGLDRLGPDAPRPEVVFMGVGLCTPDGLSQSLPVDVLGMLLPAELVRRAVGASRLVVLIADEHAKTNRFDDASIELRARKTLWTLARIRRRFGLEHMTLVRASAFHETRAFQEVLAGVERRAPPTALPYMTRQVADIAYLNDVAGPVLKVGWTLGGGDQSTERDEAAFDRLVEPWSGRQAVFVYCHPGRALDDRRRRVVPYVTTDVDKRVRLAPDEDVGDKLARAEEVLSKDAFREVRNHLKRLAHTYARMVEPVRGPLESRVQQMIDQLYGPS